MGAGLHGLNGVSPEVTVTLVNIYVLPAVMYGLETTRLTETDYATLEKYHRTLLRQLQHLPQSTAIPAIYLLTGSLPIRAIHHKKVLTFYASILRKEGSVERELVCRQLTMKTMDSNSWTVQVRELLHHYGLPSAFDLMKCVPGKCQWKNLVDNKVNNYWLHKLSEEASMKSTLSYLQLKNCQVGKTHQVWSCGTDPMQVAMSTTKARLLVQRYPLTGSRASGRKGTDKCPLCQQESETLDHFILKCSTLEDIRKPFLKKITKKLQVLNLVPTSDEEWLQCILDTPGATLSTYQERRELECITRRLCFALHNRRSVILGENASYMTVSKNVPVALENR